MLTPTTPIAKKKNSWNNADNQFFGLNIFHA
jgi:hypothetical protein